MSATVAMRGVGLAIPRRKVGEHFVAGLVHALADPLIAERMGLFTRVVDDSEDAVYRHWASTGGIAAVALLDVQPNDPRIALLRALDLPFAAVVDAANVDGFPAVVSDVSSSISTLRDFLEQRGYEHRVVYITGPEDSITSDGRAAALAELFDTVRTEASTADAVSAAEAAIANGPATLLFNSDVHAAAALAAFTQRGLKVPTDVALVSWTDSTLCQSTTPSITAINRRGSEIGGLLAERILATIAGEPPSSVAAPDPFVVVRETA